MGQKEAIVGMYLPTADNELVKYISDTSAIIHLNKGEHLVRQGIRPDGAFFLLSGLLRGYYVDVEGTEITDCFGFRYGTVAMPCGDMMKPSQINIEALEASEIFMVPYHIMEKLLGNNLTVTALHSQLMIEGAEEHWEIKRILSSYTAEQRYRWFLQQYEGLIDRVSHKHIASFLGITPVTLSRIRRTIKGNLE